jgi:hypothetical protein
VSRVSIDAACSQCYANPGEGCQHLSEDQLKQIVNPIIDTKPGGERAVAATGTRPLPSPITGKALEDWFTYHPPREHQVCHYQAIRDAGLDFARAILANTPAGADQSAAIRKVREAVMTANAAIACDGK